MGEEDMPEWMTHDRTVLCQKDPQKCNTADNYGPITCLPLTQKHLTGLIAEEMYNSLEREKILPEEQKEFKRGSRGTKDQLLIDKIVLKDCKKRRTNLSMAWIGHRKAYDLVLHRWVNECMEMFGITENLRMFLQKSLQQWRLLQATNVKELGEVNVKWRIFTNEGKKEYKLNHLLFMDD